MKYLLLIPVLIASIISAASAQEAKSGNFNPYETIGSLASTNIYLTYLSLNLINESLDESIKDSKKTKTSIETINKIVELLDKAMLKIKSLPNLDDNESYTIADAGKLCGMLKTDAQLLEKYFKSKKKQDYDSFIEQHNSVWEALNKQGKKKK